MRRTPAPRRAAVVLATALLLGSSACSDEEKQGSAGATATPGGSASSEPTSEPAADAPPEGEVVDNEEFIDDMVAGLEESTTARMTMTSDFGGGGIGAEGVVDYTSSPVSMAMTMSGAAMGGQKSDLRLVDGIMYMNLGSMSNDKFIGFDLSEPGSLPPGLDAIGDQMDPLASVEQLAPALKTVTFVGTEDVDGEELDHYAVVADTSRLESLEDIPAEAGVPPEVDYDLWFDDEFRMRRMEMAMDLAQPVTVEVELFDWGTPVDIEAPPKDQVVEPPQR